MEVLYPHCADLDVHKDTVVACVRHMANGAVGHGLPARKGCRETGRSEPLASTCSGPIVCRWLSKNSRSPVTMFVAPRLSWTARNPRTAAA